jgi:hypothetical protein
MGQKVTSFMLQSGAIAGAFVSGLAAFALFAATLGIVRVWFLLAFAFNTFGLGVLVALVVSQRAFGHGQYGLE